VDDHDHDADHDHEGTDDHSQMMHSGHMVMDEEHVNTMFAILFFVWHVAFALVLMILMAVVIYQCLKRRGKLNPEFGAEFKNNNNSKSAYAKLTNAEYGESNFDENQTPLLESVDDEENVLFVKS